MSMRLVQAAILFSTAAALQAQAPPPIIRHSPDFTVRLVDGNQMALSSLKGKVVALLFVQTTCPHCQHASQTFTRLFNEYGKLGFQPVDVAINPMANLYVKDFVRDYKISYPVGFSAPEEALGFLNIPVMERYVVPQIVWIDRKGNIRSQTPPLGDEKLLNEVYWRNMIETLAKEPASEPARKTALPRPASRSASAKKIL
jgi:peroxiredoxin